MPLQCRIDTTKEAINKLAHEIANQAEHAKQGNIPEKWVSGLSELYMEFAALQRSILTFNETILTRKYGT